MSESPQLSTSHLAPVNRADWFEYRVRAQPHHTDYGGIVWHGTYLTWMEEARVEALPSRGINFEDLVAIGCNLPVVELSIRYLQPVRMGMEAIVKTRMNEMEGVRIHFDYQIESIEGEVLFLTGRVTLVAVNLESGKVMRRLPASVKDALMRK